MARRRRRSSGGGAVGLLVLVVVVLVLGSVLLKALAAIWPVAVLAGVALVAWKVDAAKKRRAEIAEAGRIRAIRSREVGLYHQMSAREFEEAVGFLCRRDGCRDVQVTGGAGDFAADVTAITPNGLKLVVQCKRYASGNLVSGPDVQRVSGTYRVIHHANLAVVVTTSGFTRQAREMASRAGILLFDADALGGWASGTGPCPWALAMPSPARAVLGIRSAVALQSPEP